MLAGAAIGRLGRPGIFRGEAGARAVAPAPNEIAAACPRAAWEAAASCISFPPPLDRRACRVRAWLAGEAGAGAAAAFVPCPRRSSSSGPQSGRRSGRAASPSCCGRPGSTRPGSLSPGSAGRTASRTGPRAHSSRGSQGARRRPTGTARSRSSSPCGAARATPARRRGSTGASGCSGPWLQGCRGPRRAAARRGAARPGQRRRQARKAETLQGRPGRPGGVSGRPLQHVEPRRTWRSSRGHAVVLSRAPPPPTGTAPEEARRPLPAVGGGGGAPACRRRAGRAGGGRRRRKGAPPGVRGDVRDGRRGGAAAAGRVPEVPAARRAPRPRRSRDAVPRRWGGRRNRPGAPGWRFGRLLRRCRIARGVPGGGLPQLPKIP